MIYTPILPFFSPTFTTICYRRIWTVNNGGKNDVKKFTNYDLDSIALLSYGQKFTIRLNDLYSIFFIYDRLKFYTSYSGKNTFLFYK